MRENRINIVLVFQLCKLEQLLLKNKKRRMGKTVDNYLIQQLLGEGNFGKVYKAKHIKNGKQYAIKVIPAQKFKDIPKLQECTVNQINVLTQIKDESQYIVTYFDMLKTPNNFYFIYQFCNGGTLDKMIQKEGHFTEQKALKFLRQIIQAFKVLNRYHIMHRDLKPQNILIHNGNLKIADFSFCKLLENKNDLSQTMLGSPIYMAPEVLRGQIYTMKADIWSMGIVFYKMLFGKCPYQSKSIALLIKLLQKQQLQFPNQIKISRTSEQLIRKILIKDSNQRIGWEQIFDVYHITQNGQIVNKKDITSQGELRMSLRSGTNGTTPNSYRFSFPSNTNINPIQAINAHQSNGGYGVNPSSIVSPKSNNFYQPPNNINRLYENIGQGNILNIDKNLQSKKSPFKFQQQRPTLDFKGGSPNMNANMNPNGQNPPHPTNQVRMVTVIAQSQENFNFQQSLNLQNNRNSQITHINQQVNNIYSKGENVKNDRLALTRLQILVKNHSKCLQINQLILDIFVLEQKYSNYICYFLFKGVCKQVQVINENLKKQSISDSNYREFRSLIESELKELGKIISSIQEAIIQEQKEVKILGLLNKGIDEDHIYQNKQKILKLYIESLDDSDQHIRLASQVVDFIQQNILIKRQAYDRMSRQHLYKQMKNKVFKE